MNRWVAAAIGLGIMAIAPSAIAQTRLEVSNDAPLNNETLAAGNVRVVVNYTPSEAVWDSQLEYEIFYDGNSWVDAAAPFAFHGAIALQDLNNDGDAEVIVETYSGGAHCCTEHQIYTWVGDGFAVASTGMRDGSGGQFEDLNGDGNTEFVAFDNNFLYAFSSYAGSYPPSQIFTLQNGNLVETTRQFPEHLRSQAWGMFQAIERSEANGYEVNGILAGYVAQKILLGEYEEGWNLMLARYDRDSDWGLNVYDEAGEVVGQHPDFPAALRAFLMDTGYLAPDGTPR